MQTQSEGAEPTAVLIVDDDSSIRKALESLLRSEGHRVYCFSSAQDLLDKPLPGCLRCLLADVRMPRMSGPQLHAQLRNCNQSIPVVFMTGAADLASGVQAMKAGATDYLPKPFQDTALLAAVGRALDSDRARMRDQPLLDRFDRLTPRERQVMKGVVRGLMNKQIAWELKISEITVKLHRCSLMKKLALRNVVELVLAAQTIAKYMEN
ncbi:response regulator transcription factor [Novosphingobium sp. BW1]|uniref:response regulator transcription factor n=1 Tax=Novosphingobium sp. BW1 TaxID=2592621 RepID=UPI0011DE6DDC|nr:response regulator [Novosphingobium sp. BW1]TYC91401.1 response regulator transcription factor [Novosphingobium sp. BW1]